jgi:hypothetical protein
MSQKKLNDSIDEYINLKRRKKEKKKTFGKQIGIMFGRKDKKRKVDYYPEIEESKKAMKKKEKTNIFKFLTWNKQKKEEPKKERFSNPEDDDGYIELNTKEKDNYLEEEHEISQSIEKSPKLTERIKEFIYTKFLTKKVIEKAENEEDYLEDDEYEESKKKEIIEEIHELDEEEEALINRSKQLKQKKSGLINNFINIFDKGNEYEEKTKQLLIEKYEMEKEINRLENDLKRISKFTVYILHSLPKRKKDSLKDSLEFQEFKEILHKRKLIKEE